MTLRSTWPLLLGMLLLAGCTIDLQHHLSEQDANDIYVLLNENGISCHKVEEQGGNEPTYMITVSKQDAAQAAKLLSEYSLPRPESQGLDLFRKSKGMIPTATEERAMLLEALGGEVSNALNHVDGVLEAKAIVMIPEHNDLTSDQKPAPSASVFVKYRPTLEGKPPIDEAHIREFVANAVPEMKPDHVTVLLSQAQAPGGDINPDSRLVDVMGIRMTASSVTQFKLVMAAVGLLVLLMIGFSAFTLLRGGNANGAPARRRARPEA